MYIKIYTGQKKFYIKEEPYQSSIEIFKHIDGQTSYLFEIRIYITVCICRLDKFGGRVDITDELNQKYLEEQVIIYLFSDLTIILI